MPVVDANWPRADVWLSREDDKPEVLIVGVPSSKGSRADLTPMALRDRLDRFSTFHGETGVELSTVKVRDVGNWAVSELDEHQMREAVESLARGLPEVDLTIYIGGDNAITRPLVRAIGDDVSRVGVIRFGSGNGISIRGLIEEDGLPGSNVVQIGTHSFSSSAAYRSFCDDKGVSMITVADIEIAGMTASVDRAFEILNGCERVYVDVDVDVLDRAYAPGCPGARPGGLTVRQLAEGVRTCASNEKVRAMDFVDVEAELDRDGLTLDAMAHLVLTAVAGSTER